MKFKHEDLEIYKLAMGLVTEVYELSKKFPAQESYGLRSQLTRSVVSIPLNIAEGSGKHSKDDFARFLRNAVGSFLETDANLKIAINLTYLNKEDYSKVDKTIEKLYFKLVAFCKTLKNND